MRQTNSAETGQKTLFDALIGLRDRWRQSIGGGMPVVRADVVPWEQTPQGKLKWFLHPALWDRCVRTMIVFEQELPPGGQSGKQRHQGGRIHYFLEGKGYTIVDGKKYEWEAGDFLILPNLPDGTVHQHFNGDTAKRARFVAAEPNLTDCIGVDQGSGFEQLESV